MKKTILFLLALVLAASLAGVPAMATNIPVVNYSFEETPEGMSFTSVSDGSQYMRAISGWETHNGIIGPFNGTAVMSANQYTSEWWDGNNVAYVTVSRSKTSNYISQIVPGSSLTAGHLYTLSALVGRRLDNGTGYDIGYGLELAAGGQSLASVSGSLDPGAYIMASLQFFAEANNPYLGQPLEIRLWAYGTKGQSNFDMVTLTNVVPAPIPGGAILVFSGLLGMCFMGWRFRKN